MIEEKSRNFNVFAYGSLTDPQFVERLIGKVIKMVPASLKGYRILKLPDKKYPVAIKDPHSTIRGKLLLNLNLQDLKKIGKWEETPENIYKEIKVNVETEEGEKGALMYVGNEKDIHKINEG
jgi:gamma-glutamylcyclotransferase (GGCT)/AIG2-like uncharacterized protein YtfP